MLVAEFLELRTLMLGSNTEVFELADGTGLVVLARKRFEAFSDSVVAARLGAAGAARLAGPLD